MARSGLHILGRASLGLAALVLATIPSIVLAKPVERTSSSSLPFIGVTTATAASCTRIIRGGSSPTKSQVQQQHRREHLQDDVVRLDLSYHPHIPAARLASILSQAELLDQPIGKKQQKQQNLHLDLSHSALGDSGILQVLNAVVQNLPKEREHEHASPTTDASKSLNIFLTARMNRLSPAGATRLLELLTIPPKTHDGGEQNLTLASSTPEEKQQQKESPVLRLISLDLGWNHFTPVPSVAVTSNGNPTVSQQQQQDPYATFIKALQTLLGNHTSLQTLRLDRCGLGAAAARAISKGLLDRWVAARKKDIPAISIHFCGNPAMGDAGAAALAAAIRMLVKHMAEDSHEHDDDDEKRERLPMLIFDSLDLSACNIGDAGVEALAFAITTASSYCCIRHLDLSNNRITDQGALALGRALLLRLVTSSSSSSAQAPSSVSKTKSRKADTVDDSPIGPTPLQSLDLSNNKDIGDRGVVALATAFEHQRIASLILRSCRIQADGASTFGKALKNLAKHARGRKAIIFPTMTLDLSGNPIGTLRGKSSSASSMYSASRLKSQASATAASYMNLFKKSLQDVGVGALLGATTSAESDDEEEKLQKADADNNNQGDDEEDADGLDPSQIRCGAKSFASAFLDESGIKNDEQEESSDLGSNRIKVNLGLRRCFFDHSAADALAAVMVEARGRESLSALDLSMDVHLNPILEEEMVLALHGDYVFEDRLAEMAERHMDAMEALRDAKRRAAEAAAAAEARVRAEARMEAAWRTSASSSSSFSVVDDNDDQSEEETDSAEFNGEDDDDDEGAYSD